MLDRRGTGACEAAARDARSATTRARTMRPSLRNPDRQKDRRLPERSEPIRRREVVVQGMRISLPALRFMDDPKVS